MKLFRQFGKEWGIGMGVGLVALALTGCGALDGGGAASPAPAPTGIAATATNPPPANPPGPGPEVAPGTVGKMDEVRIGERVSVLFSDIPNPGLAPFDQRIREDGTITLYLDVKVKAAGKTTGELEKEIQALYVPKFYRRMTVSVRSEARLIYVDGYVRSPNRYVYEGDMTVLKAISAAGGFNEYANKKKVQLTRANGAKELVIDCIRAQKDNKRDLPVYPGDRIWVPPRIW